jgi:glycosyltransferase involved in cell wall biosynthesis
MRDRGRDGPVLPLGGDGLHLERQIFAPERSDFVWLGTIEPRKNCAAVLRAFMKLWSEGTDVNLVMIGRCEVTAREEEQLLSQLRNERRFRHIVDASDATVRDLLRGARALIFPSENEGFGIPPLEALHAGIPVIVWHGLPALTNLRPVGQVRLDRVSFDAIADAVRWFLDDTNAKRMWSEAATLTVPKWSDFARACADWAQS